MEEVVLTAVVLTGEVMLTLKGLTLNGLMFEVIVAEGLTTEVTLGGEEAMLGRPDCVFEEGTI